MKPPLYSKADIISLVCVLGAAILSVFFYTRFPEVVATHWTFNGEVDGYSSKEVAAFLFPTLIVGIFMLLSYIPRLDPRQERYAEFTRAYSILKNAIVVFLTTMYVLVGFVGIGYALPIQVIVPVLVGILFMFLGNYFGKIKNNWFVGIRTPWTLSSEQVWNKTHRLGGRLFVVGGIMLIASAFVPDLVKLPIFILIIMTIVIVPTVYSYLLFKRTKKVL